MKKLSSSRKEKYVQLEKEMRSALDLIEIDAGHMQKRGHRTFVWDATKQPTRSHYFPVYVDLFRLFEQKGAIRPEQTIIAETTTGNAGAAAAHVARRLEYDVVIFMPEDMPERRIQGVKEQMSAGSELRPTPSGEYVLGMARTLRRFLAANEEGYQGKELFAMNHSRRPESIEAIRKVTTILLEEHLPTDVTIDEAVLALGNGTTFSGVGKAVRAQNENAQLIGVEPAESPWYYVQRHGEEALRQRYGIEPEPHSHGLIGTGGWGVAFPNLTWDLLDEIELVFTQEWQCELERLHKNGHRVGHTSAASQWVVRKRSEIAALSSSSGTPRNFLGIFYDPADKYDE